MPRKEDASDCRAGTYDLLRKNCNSFRWTALSPRSHQTAVAFVRVDICRHAVTVHCTFCSASVSMLSTGLLSRRAHASPYPFHCTRPVPPALCPQRLWLRVQLGAKYQSVVAQASGGGYQPNPKADRFDVRHVSPQKHVHVPAFSKPQPSSGGTPGLAGWWT